MANPKLDKTETALAVGIFVSLCHLVWLVVLYLGGQSVLDLVNWVITLHGVSLPLTLVSLDLISMVLLVVLTFVGGALFGWVFAYLWNWTSKKF
jgi:uncharacterized membrane protein